MSKKSFEDAEELIQLGQSKTDYPTKPEEAKLEWFPNPYPKNNYTIEFQCPEFTSVCPKTHQPDFANIKIEYVANKRCLESKSLKLYLFSYRNTGMFHERIVNTILNDLVKILKPRWMKVIGIMNARGGIGINVQSWYCTRGGFRG